MCTSISADIEMTLPVILVHFYVIDGYNHEIDLSISPSQGGRIAGYSVVIALAFKANGCSLTPVNTGLVRFHVPCSGGGRGPDDTKHQVRGGQNGRFGGLLG